MNIHLLVNQSAGRGRSGNMCDSIVEEFRLHGIDVELLSPTSIIETESLLRKVIAHGCERLVVAGGDGIINLAIQILAGSTTILGIIPTGSGNDFARALNLPSGIREATATALSHPSSLDLLRVGDRWVASVLTFGFSADVNTRANRMKRPKGPSRYTIATLLSLPELRSRSVHMVVDGKDHHFDLTLGTVANTSDFGGGMQIAPEADPTDGICNLTLVTDIGKLELLRFFRRVFDGSHMDHPKVQNLSGREIFFITEGFELWGDGEKIGTSPIRIELVSEALLLARGSV